MFYSQHVQFGYLILPPPPLNELQQTYPLVSHRQEWNLSLYMSITPTIGVFTQPQKCRSYDPRVYGIKENEKLPDFWNEKMSDKKRLSIMNVHLQLTKNYSEDSKMVFDIALCIFMMMVHKHRPYFPHNFHIKSPSISLIE